MKDFDELTEDYSRGAVPDSATSSAFEISLVLIGGLITLPIFLVGGQLGSSLGLKNASIAFVIAGFVLAILGAGSGVLAAKTRLTTWLVIQYSFGRSGAKIVSLFVAFTILGWYGATVELFARAVQQLVADSAGNSATRIVYLISASVLMVSTALFGFKGLDRLSKFAVPLMLLLLLGLVYKAVTGFDGPTDLVFTMSLAKGVSASIGAFIIGVTMFPDICRYAKSPKAAVVASGLSFGIGVPLVMLFAAIPVIMVDEQDFLKVLILLGVGLPGVVLLLLATWTTNVFNLYSVSLSFAAIIESVKKWKLVIIAGMLGTGVAFLPILDNFLHFLNFLAVMIPPITGIYLADFFIIHKQNYHNHLLTSTPAVRPTAFVAWGLGSGVGYFSNLSVIEFTTVPALDAIIAGFVSYISLSFIARRYCQITFKPM